MEWVKSIFTAEWQLAGGEWEVEKADIETKQDDVPYADVLGRVFENGEFVTTQNRLKWRDYLEPSDKENLDVIIHEEETGEQINLRPFKDIFKNKKNFKNILKFLILYDHKNMPKSNISPNAAWNKVSHTLFHNMIILGGKSLEKGKKHMQNIFGDKTKTPVDWLKEVKDPNFCFYKLFTEPFVGSEKMLGRWVWEDYKGECLDNQKLKEIWETGTETSHPIEQYLNQLRIDGVTEELIEIVLSKESAMISPRNVHKLKILMSEENYNDDILLGLWPLLVNMHKGTRVGRGNMIDFEKVSSEERLSFIEKFIGKSKDPKTVGTGSFSIQTDPQFFNYFYRTGPCSAIKEEEQIFGKSHDFDVPKKLLGCETAERIVQPATVNVVRTFPNSVKNILNYFMRDKISGDHLAIIGQAAGMLGMKIPEGVKVSEIALETFERAKLPSEFKKKEKFKVKFEGDYVFVDNWCFNATHFTSCGETEDQAVKSKKLTGLISKHAFVTDAVQNGSKLMSPSFLNLFFRLRHTITENKFKDFWVE